LFFDHPGAHEYDPYAKTSMLTMSSDNDSKMVHL
jgi:hypothetical protein